MSNILEKIGLTQDQVRSAVPKHPKQRRRIPSSKQRQKILDIIKCSKSKMQYTQILYESGFARSSVTNVLNALVEQGKLEKRPLPPRGKLKYYAITNR